MYRMFLRWITRRHPLAAAWLIVGVAAAWMVATLPVFAQEAYYWCYAQHPAMSYFDHPPMAAWGIWSGTALLGDGVAGVRAFTLACALGTTWVGQLLLRRLGADSRTVVAWVVLSIGVPMLAIGHVMATPDAPLTFFFMVTIYSLWRARTGKRIGWWLAAGVAAGCGLLSKYTAGFLAVGGVIVVFLDPVMRGQLRRTGPWLALVVAAAVFSPVVIWNAEHDWVSFLFQTDGRFGEAELGGRWLAQFLLGQAGVFSPALALLVPAAMVWFVRSAWRGDARLLWLLAFGVPLPLFMAVNSLWLQVKINWLAPAFPPLIMGLLLWARETGFRSRRPRVARVVTGVIAFTLVASLAAPLIDFLPQGRGSSWSGWDRIATQARAAGARLDPTDASSDNVFFFAVDYKDSAQLSRNMALLGETSPVLAQNVRGRPALQFDYWDSPSRHIGDEAIFVVTRPERRSEHVEDAKRYFDSVVRVEEIHIRRGGWSVLDADLYACRGYKGPLLGEPSPPDGSQQRTGSIVELTSPDSGSLCVRKRAPAPRLPSAIEAMGK